MNTQTTLFNSLCRAASHILSLKDVEVLGNEDYVDIDGVAVALGFDPEDDLGEVRCFVDLGTVPEDRHLRVYTSLLHSNLEMNPARQGVIALDRESGHLILSTAFELAHIENPEDLASLLQSYAEFAHGFREAVIDAMPDDSVQSELQMNLARKV
jgi:hypothetical protein